MKVILILILLLIIFLINYSLVFETFDLFQTYQSFIPVNTWKFPNFIWNNTRLGNTRNMSYDIRSDPIIIPRTDYVWNNSSIFPIYNNSI